MKIVFCDMSNTTLDPEYAAQLREAFRKLTGWEVAEGTRIWKELTEFSLGYSIEKRDVMEVAAIFALAHDLME